MRPRYEGPTLAERLNNALGELHALKLQHEKEKDLLLHQIEQLKDQNERLRIKNKEIRRQQKEAGSQGDKPELSQQNEQNVLKIKNYLQRLQESSRQMTQVAAQCKIVDEDIQRAASQIERNIIKCKNGVEKYMNQLIKKWGGGEHLRIENQRLQMENKQLFQLTTSLQKNFRETDKLIKQLSQARSDEEIITKNKQLQSQNTRLRTSLNTLSNPKSPKTNDVVIELEEKISKLTQKLKNTEQQNVTIKNIHQRTMKKLEKLQSLKEQERPVGGEALQEERMQWMEKNQKMYDEVRKLTRDLMLSEENEKKVREELNNCLQIYGQWEQEREERKIEIEELKVAIETYLQKIEELEFSLSQKNAQLEAVQERFQVSEGEKEKIVNVYQLQVQEINDQLFKKQDIVTELEAIINREHYKLEDLKKQFTQLTQQNEGFQQLVKRGEQQKIDLNRVILEKEDIISELDLAFKLKEEELIKQKKERQLERNAMENDIQKLEKEKQEIVEVLQEYKEEYHSIQKDLNKTMEELQSRSTQELAIVDELKGIIGSSPSKNNDVWEVISKVRDKYRAVFDQLKTLRQAQIRFLHDLETKEKEHSQQLFEIKEECDRLNEEIQSSSRNQQAELKIWKMRIIDKGICDQKMINEAKSLNELLSAISNQNSTKSKSSSPVKENQQQILEMKEKLIKVNDENQEKTKMLLELKKKICDLEEENELHKKLREDAENQRDEMKKREQFHLDELSLCSKQLQEKSSRFQNQSIELMKTKELLSQHQQTVLNLQVSIEQKQSKLSELQTLKQKNEEMSECISDLNQQVQKGKQESECYLNQIKHLLEEVQSTHQENTHLILEHEELNKQIQLLSSMTETLKLKYQQSNSILNQKSIQLQNCHTLIQALEKEKIVLSDFKQRAEEKEISEMQEKSSVQQQMMASGYQIINLNLQLEQKNTAIDHLESQLAALKIKLSEQQGEVAHLNEFTTFQKRTIEEMTSKLLNYQVQQQNYLALEAEFELRTQELKEKEIKLKQLEQELEKKADVITSMIKKSDLIDSEPELDQKDEGKQEDLPEHYNIVIPEQAQQLGLESTRQSQTFPQSPFKTQQIQEELQFAKLLLQEKEQQLQKKEEYATTLALKIKVLEDTFEVQKEEVELLKKDKQSLVGALEKVKTDHNKQIELKESSFQQLVAQLLEKNQQIQELNEKVRIQKEATSNNMDQASLMKKNEEKSWELEQKISSIESELQDKVRELDWAIKQVQSKQMIISDLKLQNSDLVQQLEKVSLESEMLCKEITAVTRQKEVYQNRLNQIEDLMEELKIEEEEAGKVKSQMADILKEKGRLEVQIQNLKNQMDTLKKQMNEYSSIESDPSILKQNLIKLKSLQESIAQQQTKRQTRQHQIKQLRFQLEQTNRAKEELALGLKQQMKKISGLEDEKGQLIQKLLQKEEREVEKGELMNKLLAVEVQYNDLKEELSEKDNKVTQLKTKIRELQEKGDNFDSSMIDKVRQCQMLQKENDHLKSEIKRINKEKVLAESQASQHKFNLEQQQSAIKLRESQLSQFSEGFKNSRQTQQLVRQLKTQIQTLKRSNQHLQKMYDTAQTIKKNPPKPNEDYMGNLPLQVVSRRGSRGGDSSREEGRTGPNAFETEIPEKYKKTFEEENKVLRSEIIKNEQTNSRLRQAQRNNSSLSGELSILRGQLKTKSLNIQALEKQFKAKTQDYSKLQRKVESLSDELHLQRKRVKNFEELYQNIQSKRLKLANTKSEE